MAGSYAGAYGAGAASDELHRMLAERFEREKFAEHRRQAESDETFRRSEAAAAHERESRREVLARDEANERKRQFDTTQKQSEDDRRERRIDRTVDAQKRSMEHADDREQGLADREDQQAHQREMARSNQAFQERIMGGQRREREEATRLANEEKRKKAEREQAERDDTTKRAKESTQGAYDSVSRLLDTKGVGAGLDASYGAYENDLTAGIRGQGQARADFLAERDRLAAMLALPNLGALKGPMSDKDLLFIKQISTSLANGSISEKQAREELGRVQKFLLERGAVPQQPGGGAGATVRLQAPDGSMQDVPAAQAQHYIGLGAKVVQ